MKLFQLASALLISTSTVVSAWQCLSDANAAKIVNDSVALLLHATPEQTDYARAAEYESLSPNIQQYGDSINALRGDPLGTLVYGNSTIFVEDTLSVPGPTAINVLHIVHDCSQIVYHWEFIGVGGPQSVGRVRGFSLIIVDDESKEIEYYVEFNSYTWALNLGYTIIPAPYEKRSLKGTMKWKA